MSVPFSPSATASQALTLALLLTFGLGACKQRTEASAAPPQASATKPSGAPAHPPAPSANTARVETDEYVVALSAGPTEGSITITAKAPLHVNPEYPTAFRPEPGPVTFESAKVPLTQESKRPCADKAEDTCESTSSLRYTGATPGATVSGTVLFSVCEAERCLIEKAKVTAAVTAAGTPNGALRQP